MRHAMGAGIFLLLGTGPAACGQTTDGSTDQQTGTLSASAFAERSAELLCEVVEACCSSEEVPDRDSCEELLKDDIGSQSSAQTDYSPSAAADCIEQMEAMPQDCDAPFPVVCETVFAGRVEPGGSCTSYADCARTAQAESDCSFEGSCVLVRRAGEGDPCSMTCWETRNWSECLIVGDDSLVEQGRCSLNDGLFCSVAGQCEAVQERGAECADDGTCGKGNACVEGICSAGTQLGSACFLSFECAGDSICSDSGFCQESPDAGGLCLFVGR